MDPTIDYRRALRMAIKALVQIRDGKEQKQPDGSTVMIDWPPGVASGIARSVLSRMGITKRTTDGEGG